VKEVTEKAKGKEQNELQQLLEQFQKQIQEAGQLHKLPIECLVLPDGILDKLARRFAQKVECNPTSASFPRPQTVGTPRSALQGQGVV